MTIGNWLKHVLIALLLTATVPAEGAMIEDLSQGLYVLMMRHADAPGYSDPPGFDLNNCKTQERN